MTRLTLLVWTDLGDYEDKKGPTNIYMFTSKKGIKDHFKYFNILRNVFFFPIL